MKNISFEFYETIAIGVPNPKSVTSMTIPPGLNPEQLARIETAIDAMNAFSTATLIGYHPSLWRNNENQISKIEMVI